MNQNILLVEDEEALRMVLSDRLQKEGYIVDCASDGETGLRKATSQTFHLLILDLMLPRRNGLDICREVRARSIKTPILILTARSEAIDKLVGLKMGADDYVTKPFDMQELTARIEALLRRVPADCDGVYQFGSVNIDVRAKSVTRQGINVYLSNREFQLLTYFIERAGLSISREQILRDVWGSDLGIHSRTVDTHVANLRQKLETDPRRPELIFTMHGFGYRFVGGHHYSFDHPDHKVSDTTTVADS